MPNWCSNNLEITGEKEALAKFVAAVVSTDPKSEDEYDILKNLVPCPAELLDTEKKFPGSNTEREKLNLKMYGYKDWYDWSVANWDTKWPETETSMTRQDDDCVGFRFLTAWSPPIAAFKTISGMYPALTFILSYQGEGFDYVGATSFFDGEIAAQIEQNCVDIKGWEDINFDDEEGELDGFEVAHELVDEAEEAFRLQVRI
jgi:hypothetical protein